MRKMTALAAAMGAVALFAAPASAQDRRNQNRDGRPLPPSPAAQQALSQNPQPDVLLDVPRLEVDEITLEVNNLQVHIALDARLANLLKLTAGADASIDNVKLTIKGVRAQATLIVRLDNVRAIIDRTLQTLDNNPQIMERLLTTVDNTVGTVGGIGNNALRPGGVVDRTVGTVGGVANNAVGQVGNIAGGALRNGQVLNLVGAGLSQVSQTVNSAGQTVRRVRDRSGQLLEVVTDSANRVVSSRRVGQ